MKRILITGSNKGIGLATAKNLLQSYKETFVLMGSRDLKKGEEAFDSLISKNPEWKNRLDLVQLDVESEKSVSDASLEIAKKFDGEPSPLYSILNNAGIANHVLGLNKIVQVNTYGTKRVCDVFLKLLDPNIGRVVNVTSASGPVYLANCNQDVRKILTNPNVKWKEIDNLLKEYQERLLELDKDNSENSIIGNAYGFSKACANAYTIYLAREYPKLKINSCTPGFIETDLTRPLAIANGKTPAEMGMKTPDQGTSASIFLLMGNPLGSGHYYGSDCKRSPLDRYRSPGDPPYSG